MVLLVLGFACANGDDAARLAALPDYGADVPAAFVWPLSGGDEADWTAGGFTPRWKITEDRYDFHQGLDLLPRVYVDGVAQAPDQEALAQAPPEVYAVADGVVDGLYPVGSTSFPNSGNVVRLAHRLDGASDAASNVYYTYAMHLEDFCDDDGACLAEGQTVKQGDPIGHLGETLSTTESVGFRHLHFEVRGHGWQFYAVNPLRYLPHADTVEYAPEIVVGDALPGECAGATHPTSPSFLVRLAAGRDELDVNRVAVTLTDLDTGRVVDEDVVDFEGREGIAYWHDIDGDDQIRISGTWGEDEPSSFEYDADALLGAAQPVFDTCGGETRNVYRSTSEGYTLELLYTGMTGAPRLRIEAEVCDIYGQCAEAEAVEL